MEDAIEANIVRFLQSRRPICIIRVTRREFAYIHVFALTLYVIYSHK